MAAGAEGRLSSLPRVDRRMLAYGSIASAIAIAVYMNALHNPFVYDDYHTVIANVSIRTTTDIKGIVLHDITRPIVNFSYAIDQRIWGPRPFGFHLTGVLLHALNAWLLLWQMRRVGLAHAPAFAATLLFAVHPMMSEAVGYVSGRSEVLCATFFLAALLCGDRWLRGGGATWAAAMLVAWLGAALSKETGAMFPFVLLAYDLLLVPGRVSERRRRLTFFYAPFIGLIVLAGIVRLWVLVHIEYPAQARWHWAYLLVDADVFRRYISMLVLPRGQAMFHEVAAISSLISIRVLGDLATIAVVAWLAWRLRRVDAVASLGILWFGLLLLPASVLTAFNQGEPMTEHRVYLASLGFFLVVAAVIRAIGNRLRPHERAVRAVAIGGLAAVVASFAAETLQRNAVWRSPVSLWRESVDLAPFHPRPRMLLAEALEDEGRRSEAIEQYRIAVQLRPSDPDGHIALGRSLMGAGDWLRARDQFEQALTLDPSNAAALHARAALDNLEARLVK